LNHFKFICLKGFYMSNADHLIWVDLEMTGLEPDHDTIIEIATIVTDSDLNVLAEGPVFAIHQSAETMAGMDDWNTKQHGGSGLTQRVLDSQVAMAQAEVETVAWLAQYVAAGASPMCGNSIGQDRRFMVKYMPKLEAFFHYRNLDVSSVKELARRWRPDVLAGVKKNGSHLAMDDIRDSIAELQHYRETFFRLDGE
jgi:oligoribonuclease|tara:strand:+ start:212 stop:802 length:591 start_codon:yes stop_codon:yes gene_type:complete